MSNIRSIPLIFIFLSLFLMILSKAFCAESDWSIGVYGGKYFDTEPGAFADSRTNYLNQFIIALTASRTVWRAEAYPLSLEVDGMIGQQFGLETLQEIATEINESIKTIISRKGYAVKHLRKRLQELYAEFNNF